MGGDRRDPRWGEAGLRHSHGPVANLAFVIFSLGISFLIYEEEGVEADTCFPKCFLQSSGPIKWSLKNDLI